MIDLHSHMLPGLDDGAADIGVSVRMARISVADGVSCVACTPHILPGVYHNTGPAIRQAVSALQDRLTAEGIALQLVPGSDAHIAPDMIARLRSGQILSLADSRYVLVEPPHHVAPAQLEDFFFALTVAGFVPILTHPERLTWIKTKYSTVKRIFEAGAWMQLTAGSLTGAFGKQPQYWAERMLDEGMVHLLASDAHDPERRTPRLSDGLQLAARRVGDAQAEHLVLTRPKGILANAKPTDLPAPAGQAAVIGESHAETVARAKSAYGSPDAGPQRSGRSRDRPFAQRMWHQFFGT